MTTNQSLRSRCLELAGHRNQESWPTWAASRRWLRRVAMTLTLPLALAAVAGPAAADDQQADGMQDVDLQDINFAAAQPAEVLNGPLPPVQSVGPSAQPGL